MVKRVIASLAIILLLFTSSDMALFPVMVTAIAATEENAVNSHNGVNNTNYSYIDERHPEDDFSDADEHEAGQEDDFIHENEVKEDEDKESTDNETLVIEDDTISHEDVLTDDIADISMLNIANTINGDVTISTHTTISQDTLFTGNVTIDANVTIEESVSVVVLGTVNIDSGVLVIRGNVVVYGNFRIQAKDSSGNFGVTSGFTQLQGSAKLTVYGDFYTQTTAGASNQNFNHTSSFTIVLELHGNFTQIGTNTFFRNFNYSHFKLVFAGSGEQRISIDRLDGNVSLGRIEVINSSQTIHIDTPINHFFPLNSFTVKGDLEVATISGSDQTINIDGSFIVAGRLIIEHTLNITGDVYFKGNNILSIRDKHVTVHGDFRIQTKDGNGDFDVTSGYAQLYNSAKLTVYGDFYTQTTAGVNGQQFSYSFLSMSVLELHGNFTQIGTNTFFRYLYESYFKLIFAGSGEQRISVDRVDGQVCLGRVEVTNSSQTIHIDTPIHRLYPLNSFTVKGDLEVADISGSDQTINVDGSFIIAGRLIIEHTLNITGDVYFKDNSLLSIRDNHVTVHGDFRIQAKDSSGNFGVTSGFTQLQGSAKLTVYGDFYTQTTAGASNQNFNHTSSFTIVLELHGNFTQIGTNTFFRNFNYSHFKLVFAGSGEQRISIDRLDSNVSLGRIEVINSSQTIHIDTPINHFFPLNSFTVKGDLEVATISGSDQTINIDGSFIIAGTLIIEHTLIITGDVYFKGNNILSIRDNHVTVNGDFRIQTKDSNGNFGVTSGYAQLYNSAKLTVYGDFYTQTTAGINGQQFSYSFLSMSVLELHGNFTQIGTNTSFRHLNESLFKFVFAGGGEQRISVDRLDFNVSIGRIEQTSVGQVLRVDTPLSGITAGSNLVMTLANGAYIDRLNVGDGYNVNILSDANLTTVTLNDGGRLQCGSNATINGWLTVNNGSLVVQNDLTVNNNGNISMININGSLLVRGDLIINKSGTMNSMQSGTLTVRRNIILEQPTNLTTGANHYTSFTGNVTQEVKYPANGTVRFGRIAIPNMNNPQHIITDRGGVRRFLDSTHINGSCSSNTCWFEECSHAFPTLTCASRLRCPDTACVFDTTGRTCRSCITCTACSTCISSRIFTSIGDSSSVITGIQITGKPTQINGAYTLIGATTQWSSLGITTTPSGANSSVTWGTSNANVATIDRDTGLITAIAPGTVTITAISTANANVRDTFTLAIRNYVYISFDGNGYTSGNTPANILALSGTNYTLPQRDRLSRAGYVFADWHCVTSGNNFTMGTNMTLPVTASGTWVIKTNWNNATDSQYEGRFMPFAWPGTQISVRFDASVIAADDMWLENMKRGIDIWNISATPVSFVESSSSGNEVSVVYYHDEAYGWLEPLNHSNGQLNHFKIVMNAQQIENNAINLENFITSVIVHELAHSIGLEDNPMGASYFNGSIMNTGDWRNRNELIAPTDFDIESVNTIY